MSNITVSSAVDTMLQSANNSAIRSNIGAISTNDLANMSITFGDEIVFDDQANFDGDALFSGDVNFQSSATFEDDMDTSNITVDGTALFQGSVTCEGSFSCEDEAALSDVSISGSVTINGGDLEIDSDNSFGMLGSGDFTMYGGRILGPSLIDLSNGTQPSSPQNGMIIYNSSAGKFQGYANGVWVDLH